MRRLILALGLVAGFAWVALAAITYITFEQVTVANTAIGFTGTKIALGLGHPQAVDASCRLQDAEIRWTIDGTTPTTSVGTLMEPGDVLVLHGNDILTIFRGIRTGATSGILNCHYSTP